MLLSPRRVPIRPPIQDKRVASRINWIKRVCWVAPNERRMPISLVRSMTEMVIILVIPMPPTRSVILSESMSIVDTVLRIVFAESM